MKKTDNPISGLVRGANVKARPLYEQVKLYIMEKLVSGEWAAGSKIESELKLVKRFSVSRMTVNRALRELTAEGKLIRKQGVGTFVANEKPLSPLFDIKPIDQEIRDTGAKYSCEIHHLQAEKAGPEMAMDFGIAPYGSIYHSILIHKSDGEPFQLADRFVNPQFAGDFLKQDFTKLTPSEYLLNLYPISEAEHIVEAVIPDAWIRKLLNINASEPCLMLYRKTWVGTEVATMSKFYYPGSRHRLGGRFTAKDGGQILTI